jgi:hypothetical protein
VSLRHRVGVGSSGDGVRVLPSGLALDSFFAALARTDSNRFVDADNEDLSVANAARLRTLLYGSQDLADDLVRDHHFDFYLGYEIDNIRRASIDLFLASGASEASYLRHRHPLYANHPKSL